MNEQQKLVESVQNMMKKIQEETMNTNAQEGHPIVAKVGEGIGVAGAKLINGTIVAGQEAKKNGKSFLTGIVTGFVKERAQFKAAEALKKLEEKPTLNSLASAPQELI